MNSKEEWTQGLISCKRNRVKVKGPPVIACGHNNLLFPVSIICREAWLFCSVPAKSSQIIPDNWKKSYQGDGIVDPESGKNQLALNVLISP